jgi:hypothetical protein
VRLPAPAFAGAAAALIAAGLWVSLHYSLAAWKADPDIFTPVELWRGIMAHGPGFARTWRYTEDNWLLSLVPAASLAYAAFGATARTAVLVGWGVFVVCVALLAWLVARLAGWRTAALAAGTLLFANYYALGPLGFLSYPVSHDVSMAWGLLVLALAVAAVERGSYAAGIAAGAAVFVDVLSDPWAGPAIALPLILASGALAASERRTRTGRSALVLGLAAGVGFLVAYKHPFGLFRFLQRGHFVFGGSEAARANLGLARHALAVMFQIAPGASPDAAAVQAVSLAALATMVGGAAVLLVLRLRAERPGRRLATGVAVLSIGAIGMLYVLGRANADAAAGRFFPNLVFLGALLITLAASLDGWSGKIARGAALAYAALFMAAGAASAPRLWTAPLAPSEPPEAQALGGFLASRGLAYGYGPYWGASALAMQSLTKGAVVIRPVLFAGGRVRQRPVETSSLWFRADAEPAGARPFLVIRSDPENCPSVPDCEAAAVRQFGPPAERLADGDAVVLVWNTPLAPRIGP